MIRQGLWRCAGLASRAASTSILCRSRAALPIAASLSRPNVPLSLIGIARVARAYGGEAIAAADPEASTSQEANDKFADLTQLGVHPNLLKAITDDMGYESMTPVQAKTITPALKGTDIVAQAKTGTGKTIAFLLPLLQRMLVEDPKLALRQASYTAKSDDIRGIVLSPTRELAEQIAVEARRLTRHTGLIIQSAVGGTNKASMLRQTQRQGCHLMVATPGRLNDLLHDSASGVDAPKLAALVLDEADRMLDVGFEQELHEITKCLPKPDEKIRQTMLVSATIPDDVIRLARSMVRPDDFEFVQTIPENESLTHDKVPQHIVALNSWANMFPAMFEFIDREIVKLMETPGATPFKALVYFNTTALVQLAGEMGYHRRRSQKMKVSTFAIHSKLSQMQRTKAADTFRHSKSAILFSSDVTARGMDFPNVTHVIQIDTPRDRESYIHRLGRTGRQNKDGEGWLFLPPLSATSARRLLRNLPLQPNKSLESATADIGSEELSKYHNEVKELSQAVNRGYLNGAYTSLFGGQTAHREELVDDLNAWATKGWGWSEPPPVSSSWARKQGLMNTSLNIRDDLPDNNDRSSGGFQGNSRFNNNRGSGSGYGDRRAGGGRQSSDPFMEMGRQVRRDDMGGGQHAGGGRGGYGGGRGFNGGGRGFSGGNRNNGRSRY